MYKKFADLLYKTNKTAYQVSKDTGISTSTLRNLNHNRTSRISFDILEKYRNSTVSLERMRAIENFNEADVKVSMGDTKKRLLWKAR